MLNNRIFPYYFPTTAIFVDDNIGFLRNFSLELDDKVAYRLYDSPLSALEDINNQIENPLLSDICPIDDLSQHEELSVEQAMSIVLSKLYKQIYNKSRFNNISVAIVDYDMPDINGLEFCKRINNNNIRKVLLTGVADEKQAVKAFNEGIIDCYVVKNKKDTANTINTSIKKLQRAYFNDSQNMSTRVLASCYIDFIHDSDFTDSFHDICIKNNIVEHYITIDPNGLLCVDADGNLSFLIVQTPDDLKVHIEIARDENAPQALLESIKTGESIPYFWATDGYYSSVYKDWESCLYPAEYTQGKQKYYYSLIKKPDLFDSNNIFPYKQHLDQLDSEIN